MARSRGQQREILVEDEDSIWEFVHRSLVEKERFTGICSQLWKEYIKENGAYWTVQQLDEYYNEMMVRNLYKADIEPRKILELYKILKLPLTEHAETMLETISRAVFRLNRERLLVSFRCIDTIAKKVNRRPPTPEIEDSPQKYVSVQPAEFDELVTSASSLVRKPSKIVNWSAPNSTTSAEAPRQDQNAGNFGRDAQLQRPPRVNRDDAPNDFATAENNDNDEIDEKFSIECKVSIRATRRQFELDEDVSIWRYLYSLVFDKTTGMPTGDEVFPKGNAFWVKYIAKTKSKRSVANLSSHFRKKMLNGLYELPIKREQILWLHKILNIIVPAEKKQRMEKMYKAKIKMQNEFIFGWKINENERQDEHEENLYDLEETVSNLSPDKSPIRLQREENSKKTPRKRNQRLFVSSDSSDESDDESYQPRPTKRGKKTKETEAERRNELGSTEPLEIPQQNVNGENGKRKSCLQEEANKRSDPGWWGLESHDPANDENSEEPSSSTSALTGKVQNRTETRKAMNPINPSGEKEKSVFKKPKVEVDVEADEVQYVGPEASSDGQQNAEPCQEVESEKNNETSKDKVQVIEESPTEKALNSLKRVMLKRQFLSNPQELYKAVEKAVKDGKVESHHEISKLKNSLKKLTMESLANFRDKKVHEYKARAVSILCDGMEDFPVVRKDFSHRMIDTILENVRTSAWDKKSYFIMIIASRETFQNSISQFFA